MPQNDDPLTGYTPSWRTASTSEDDPLAGYTPDWRSPRAGLGTQIGRALKRATGETLLSTAVSGANLLDLTADRLQEMQGGLDKIAQAHMPPGLAPPERRGVVDTDRLVAAVKGVRDRFRAGMGAPRGRVESVGSVLARVGEEAAPYLLAGPIAGAAITAVKAADPENSQTEFVREMAGGSKLGRALAPIAESTAGRIAGDVALDVATAGLLKGASAGAKAVARKLDVGDAVTQGLKDLAPEDLALTREAANPVEGQVAMPTEIRRRLARPALPAGPPPREADPFVAGAAGVRPPLSRQRALPPGDDPRWQVDERTYIPMGAVPEVGEAVSDAVAAARRAPHPDLPAPGPDDAEDLAASVGTNPTRIAAEEDPAVLDRLLREAPAESPAPGVAGGSIGTVPERNAGVALERPFGITEAPRRVSETAPTRRYPIGRAEPVEYSGDQLVPSQSLSAPLFRQPLEEGGATVRVNPDRDLSNIHLAEYGPLFEIEGQPYQRFRTERPAVVDANGNVVERGRLVGVDDQTPFAPRIAGAESGAALREVLRGLAGAGVGAGVGAAADTDDPFRGAVVGGLVGGGLGARSAHAVEAARPSYLESPAVQEVLGTVSTGAEAPSVGERLKAALRGVPEAGRKLYTRVVDETDPLRRFGREVGDTEGVANEVARAGGWRGAAGVRLEEALAPILRAAGSHREGVVALAKAERALELARNGLPEKGVDLVAAQRVVDELGAVPEVRQGADALRGYYDQLLQFKRDHGVLTPEAYDAIRAKGEFYTPFVRDLGEETALPTAGGGRFTNRGTGVRKMSDEAATAKTVDPFEQAVLDTYEAHRTVAKQRVTNVVSRIVEEHPEEAAPFLKRVAKPEDVKHGRTVQAIVNGKRETYEVKDPELYDAWAAFSPYEANLFTRLLSPFKKSLQTTVTLLPDFAIANGIRDNVQSGIQYGLPARQALMGAGLGAAAGAAESPGDRIQGALAGAGIGLGLGAMTPNVARTLSAMRDILGPRLGGDPKIYKEWLREGGAGFGIYPRDTKSAKRVLEALEREGVDPRDILHPRSWVEALQKIGSVVEEAPRLARYKAMRAAGADPAAAVAASKDISLDFSRSGKDTKAVNAVTAFFNAKVQGWDKLARLLKDPKTWATGAAMITAPSIALWTINQDNPEYWNRPQWERNLFWLVPKPDGGFLRIPKPFELGFLFASLPERILDYAREKDPDTLKYALSDMLSTTTEGTFPIPTAVEPVLENAVNFDFFRNRPVVSPGLERLPPELQYDNRTSTAALKLGQAVGASPQKVDNLLSGYFGSAGHEVLGVTDRLARASGLDTRPLPPEGRAPLVGRFVTRDDQVAEPELLVRREFAEAEKARNGVLALLKRGQLDEARDFVEKNRDLLLRYYELRPVAKGVQQASDLRRQVSDLPDLPSEEKRAAISSLNARLAEALRKARLASARQ